MNHGNYGDSTAKTIRMINKAIEMRYIALPWRGTSGQLENELSLHYSHQYPNRWAIGLAMSRLERSGCKVVKLTRKRIEDTRRNQGIEFEITGRIVG